MVHSTIAGKYGFFSFKLYNRTPPRAGHRNWTLGRLRRRLNSTWRGKRNEPIRRNPFTDGSGQIKPAGPKYPGPEDVVGVSSLWPVLCLQLIRLTEPSYSDQSWAKTYEEQNPRFHWAERCGLVGSSPVQTGQNQHFQESVSTASRTLTGWKRQYCTVIPLQ